MISCPHSIFFFRGSVGNFDFIEGFKGNKTAEELTESPNPLLVAVNEGYFYRAIQSFTSTEDYISGPGKQVQAGTYLRVTEYEDDVYKFEDYGNRVANTFRDWHIVPLERPVVAPPQQKLHTIDIPGANGILDLSNSLTKYPTFGNRTGSFKFAVVNEDTDTPTAYTKMMKFLQGTNVKMILEDDPTYFYDGRVYVENVDPKADGTWTEFSIGYDLYPYRLSINTSLSNWLWNPFNFETDFIQDSSFNAIQINSPNSWTTKNFKGLVDMMPVVPTFTVSAAMQAQLLNSDIYGGTWKSFNLKQGTYKYQDIIFCEFTEESLIKMRFKGQGTVTIDFRSGRL